MSKIGAHVSAAGNLARSFENALKIGADCMQIFISPPQQWAQTKHDESEIEQFRKFQQDTRIGPNFIHGCYLINLGTDNSLNLAKAISWLTYAQNLGSKLGLKGVIFHPGSHKGLGFEAIKLQVIDSLKQILANSPQDIYLILETTAGAGGSLGNFVEMGELIKGVNDPRLRICLDTAHIFAAGYDIRTKEGLNQMIEELDKHIGLENLVVIHCNDSKVDLGSGKDRHENIGEGFITLNGFQLIINHPKLAHLPFILEVPGTDKKGPDKENIDKLRSLMITMDT